MADTAQERAEEQERLRSVLMETVLLLCKSSLSYEHSLSVQGVIGITMDDQVMLVHVNEKVQEQAKEAGKRRKRTYVSTSEDDLVVVKQEIKDEPNDPTPTMSAQQSYATPHNDSVRVPDASSFTDSNDAASFQYDDPKSLSPEFFVAMNPTRSNYKPPRSAHDLSNKHHACDFPGCGLRYYEKYNLKKHKRLKGHFTDMASMPAPSQPLLPLVSEASNYFSSNP